jgi:hypothetical protein
LLGVKVRDDGAVHYGTCGAPIVILANPLLMDRRAIYILIEDRRIFRAFAWGVWAAKR